MLCCLLVKIWCLVQRKGGNWVSWSLVGRLLLPMWVPKLLRAPLLLLPPLQSLLNQPLLIRGRKGWWRQLPSKTRIPAQASSSRGKEWMMSWLHHTQFYIATLPPLWRTLLVPPPPATSWCLNAGGRAPLGVITACLLLLNCPHSSRRFSKPSKVGKGMARAKIP